MQSPSSQAKQINAPGLKQVKVDNWGTFFLQRLQQLYFEEELLDLTIKFPTSNITIQAHRLVITTCTDYFMQLERKLKENNEYFDGILIMPPDMPYECVKSIISFMYTGQLEYWTSEQNALYKTAQKMNMSVLTKLLDAQFNTSGLQQTSPVSTNEKSIIAITKPLNQMKKSTSSSQEMPSTPLPGRKLPIWRRKIETYSPSFNDYSGYPSKRQIQSTPGPSRFDLPEVEDFALGVFSSFDDITYNTKPIVKAHDNKKDETGESSYNRSISDADNTKNDTTEDEEDENLKRDRQWENSDDDWTGPKGILRDSEAQPSPSKRVRFELEEKENLEKSKNSTNPGDSISNHAKIIREVLKKYPHLVKNNKNIRLKIMQKESKSAESNTPGKTKVSYVVLKSDHLMSGNTEENQDGRGVVEANETGPWKCRRCDIDEEYTNYYMYRRHMQDVHEEKFDPRVCEHCGYKATKRNILMYHLYTKHNVPPPKSMSFPKCHACSYVALSETLLVRHQINHNHRPMARSLNEVQCSQCSLTFKDVSELASHEMNTGHGTSINGKDHKGHRCPHCSKVFVRPTNLQVHIDCAHKDLRDICEVEPIPEQQSIELEPSSEAEALSHVASGIAASLSVGDTIVSDSHVVTSDAGYLVPEMELSNIAQETTYNGHDMHGQQMIMLIDNESYQGEIEHQQQPQQLEISSNEQLVMQGTEEGMIVYIHENEDQSERQVYETYQEDNSQETEEIVEEVEEVEEVVEEVEEEEEIIEEGGEETTEMNQVEEEENEQIEEVIQYVEEETEIVEYDEEQVGGTASHEGQESMMIIEEEHLESQESSEESQKQKENTSGLAAEWDDDSTEVNES